MEYEYNSLRTELLEWQNRRITLLTTSFTIVTGVLAFGQGFGARIPWWTVSVILLVVLSAACRLTEYAGYGNQRIGAFLQVFHDPGATLKWETRNTIFKNVAKGKLRGSDLNRILFWFYLILAGISAFLPPLVFKGALPVPYDSVFYNYGLDWLVVGWAGVLFVVSLGQMRKSQADREREKLVELWTQVRKQKDKKEDKPTMGAPAPVRTIADSQSVGLIPAPNASLQQPGSA